MNAATIEAIVDEERTVLQIRGPMLIAGASALLDAGRKALRSTDAAQAAVLDLAGVQEVDSSALSVLLAWLRTAAKCGVSLRLASPPASLLSLAALYGVSELLPFA